MTVRELLQTAPGSVNSIRLAGEYGHDRDELIFHPQLPIWDYLVESWDIDYFPDGNTIVVTEFFRPNYA